MNGDAVTEGVDTGLSEGVKGWLDDHLDSVRRKIVEAAREISGRDGTTGNIEPQAVAEAARLYTSTKRSMVSTEPTFGRRVFEFTTGLTAICALLAIVFGWLGFWAQGGISEGWLDITKIFAGAVVGSAGATAISRPPR